MKFMLALVLIGAACRSGYKEEATATPAPGAAPAGSYAAPAEMAPPAGPSFVAQVVTIDAAAPSVTLRETFAALTESSAKTSAPELKPGDRTLRVEGTAVTTVTTLKAGDQVRVSCREFMGTTETTGSGATGTSAAGTSATGTSGTGMSATSAPMTGTTLGRCESIVAMTLVTGAATGQ
jgi:hypothetical protein